MALAGAAADGEAMNPLGDQPLDLGAHQRRVQILIGIEAGDRRRDDAAQLPHGGDLPFVVTWCSRRSL